MSGRPKTPNTSVTLARSFFSAALDLLEECEREWNTAEVGVRENIQIRLEYLIVAPQQVLPFVSINSAVLNEILGNIRLLHGQWVRHDSSNCTNLAVYSVASQHFANHNWLAEEKFPVPINLFFSLARKKHVSEVICF